MELQAPNTGISQSPHTGFEKVVGMDIHSIPGIVKLNNILAKESGATIDSQPLWIVKNPASPANLYALSANGKVWTSANSGDSWAVLAGNTAGGAGQGLAFWKGCLFVMYGAGLDVYKVSNTTWYKNWFSGLTNDSAWQPILVSKLDQKLYIGNGRYISSVEEVAGQDFDPATGGTYTQTATETTLPEDYRIKCLAELGSYIMIGTWQGTNIYNRMVADIFPWTTVPDTFENPIQIEENGVNAMITKNGYLYILAGIEGHIYKSNGSNVGLIGKIPESICNITGSRYIVPYPGSICSYKGRITFGVSGDGTSTDIGGCGVYSLQETADGNILTCEHLISTGNDGSATAVLVTSLLPITRNQICVGWKDATSYGVDRTNVSSYGTAATYVSFFDTPFIEIGSNGKEQKVKEIEFSFVRPLRTNESFRVAYRDDITATPTTLATYAQSTIGAVMSYIYTIPFDDIVAGEYIQLRVYLCGTTTTPELRKIRFI